jgi:hypothetical protein
VGKERDERVGLHRGKSVVGFRTSGMLGVKTVVFESRWVEEVE